MRRFILTAAVTVAAALPAAAQDAAIRGVISDQFRALGADDFAGAFAHASPAIKGIFGTPERFGQMVRQGYPMVYRQREVRFLDLRTVAGRLWQRVMVIDEAGRAHVLDYQMIETGDGWQINGVQLLPAGGVGA
jgi:hypothetical protein